MSKEKRQAQAKGKKGEPGKGRQGRNKNVGGSVTVGEFNEAAAPTKVTEASAMVKLPPMPRAKRSRKPKPMHECICGCGEMTRSTWTPGHDARAKGWAIRIERGICTMKDVNPAERKGAEYMLKARKGVESKIKIVKPEAKAEAAADTAVNQ